MWSRLPAGLRSTSRAGLNNDAVLWAWQAQGLRDAVLLTEGSQLQCLGRVLPDV